MAQFLPVFDIYHELKYWEDELTASITNLYQAHEYGRKAWVEKHHKKYHDTGMVPWGKFFCPLVVRMICPAVEKNAYQNPKQLGDFLECWYGVMQSQRGNTEEKYLASRVYALVLSLHAAFKSTTRSHLVVTNLEELYSFAEQVREDEQA